MYVPYITRAFFNISGISQLDISVTRNERVDRRGRKRAVDVMLYDSSSNIELDQGDTTTEKTNDPVERHNAGGDTAIDNVQAEKEKNYHARILYEMTCDERNFLYYTFVLPIIQDFEAVNAAFQATDPRPSKVSGELKHLHRSLVQRLYEDESMKTAFAMNRAKYGDKFHYELTRSRVSEQEKHNIKQRCYDFLHEAKNQLEKRQSHDIDTIGNLKYFDPKMCLNQLRKPFPSISATFDHLTDDITNASRKTSLLQIQYDNFSPWTGHRSLLMVNCQVMQ
ncbi:hypothetical protein Pmani_009217 [Petrolisthes manimaculis]|uniref:Uncharacterized protein n=1 Tax=Petrolisthes manimaculis TaxID=1843537 RepID=A0AAE1Q586_9EUCA|nr:hypothetical protein Pmani_009217 [Petrolisthes manimaculis]